MTTYADMNEAVRAHYPRLMEPPEPWCVDSVSMDPKFREVTVLLSYPPNSGVACPTRGKECSVYDHRKRRRRHPVQIACRTIVECDVPRSDCPEHGKHLIEVPWAEPRGRFTLEVEAFSLVRRKEHRELTRAAEGAFKRTTHLRPGKRDNRRQEQKQTFRQLRSTTLKVGRAFAIKETSRPFGDNIYEGSSEKFYKRTRLQKLPELQDSHPFPLCWLETDLHKIP